MRVSSGLLTLALVIEAALGSPVRRAGYALKERSRIPRQWTESGPAPPEGRMVFSVGLKQSNFDELERQLYEGKHFASALTATVVIVLY